MKMKVRDIKAGEIFTIDNTYTRPKLKLNNGFLDMRTQYIYINKEHVNAAICTESELTRILRNWGWTPEKFEKYRKMLIERYINDRR